MPPPTETDREKMAPKRGSIRALGPFLAASIGSAVSLIARTAFPPGPKETLRVAVKLAEVEEAIQRARVEMVEIAKAVEAISMRIGPLAWGISRETSRSGDGVIGGLSTVTEEALHIARQIGELAKKADDASRRLERMALRATTLAGLVGDSI